MLTVNKVDSLQPVQWFKDGWQVFKSNPLNWALIALLFGVIAIVLSVIPLLGPIALNLIVPVLMSGMLLMARNGDSEVMGLFNLFSQEKTRNQLLILGALMLGASVVVAFLSGIFLGEAVRVDAATGMPDVNFGSGSLLFLLLAGLLMGMLFAFAPALVVFKGMDAVGAVKGSFNGALANILPFIVFLVIYMVLAFFAAIPFMLGFLVLIPVMVGAVYAAYKDIFA